jgi:hypothetical protein
MLVLNLQQRQDIIIKDLKNDVIIARLEKIDNIKNKVVLYDSKTSEIIVEFTILGDRNKIGFNASCRFNIYRENI